MWAGFFGFDLWMTMKIVINGAGVAGLTLAWLLLREGHDVTITEKSTGLRDDGYMIDFFGPGYDMAEKIGLLQELEAIHYPIKRLAFMDSKGAEKLSLAYQTLRKSIFDGRHFNFLRGDLERVLFDKIQGKLSIRFQTTVESFQQLPGRIEVLLSNQSMPEEADLLVGADGIHSQIRQLAFGHESEYVSYLGYHAIAFTTHDRELVRQVGNHLYTLTAPGKQISVYPVRNGQIATLFLYSHDGLSADFTPDRALVELSAKYAGMNWMIPRLIEVCGGLPNLYFDAVSQVVMPIWHKGRVVLIGDACHCVSLIAGQGASLAMAGAYVLQQELSQSESVPAALAQYERKFRPVIERKQRSGRNLARWFVPESSLRLRVRDALLETLKWPMIARIVRYRVG
jgi:2-polyprenyl-6-methoxyphenol hydroxylase-like FAD-dependent oxidoreductase